MPHRLRLLGFLVLSAGTSIGQVLTAAESAPASQSRFQQAKSHSGQQAANQGQADTEGIPPPLKRYKGRRIAPTMHYSHAAWLLRDVRQQEEDCEQLLQILEVQPGQTICDLGCGNGFYTLRLAQMVGPQGKVLAVDIQPEMLSMLNERLQQTNIQNVEPILGSVIDPHLPDASVDLMLLVDVYHEFSHPVHMLRAIRKALKPGGRMVLVEFRLEDPNVPIRLEHKMSKKQILREIPPNGFKLVREYDKLPWQHVMWFEATSDADEKHAVDTDAPANRQAPLRDEEPSTVDLKDPDQPEDDDVRKDVDAPPDADLPQQAGVHSNHTPLPKEGKPQAAAAPPAHRATRFDRPPIGL